MIMTRVIVSLACVALAFAAYSAYMDQGRKLAQAEMNFGACVERINNVLEDKQSDALVDHPSDFDVPDRWLLPN